MDPQNDSLNTPVSLEVDFFGQAIYTAVACHDKETLLHALHKLRPLVSAAKFKRMLDGLLVAAVSGMHKFPAKDLVADKAMLTLLLDNGACSLMRTSRKGSKRRFFVALEAPILSEYAEIRGILYNHAVELLAQSHQSPRAGTIACDVVEADSED